MKKSLLILLAFVSLSVMAANPHRVYCELLGKSKFFSAKVKVSIDFGQNPYESKNLVNEKGKSITFNSMVDAMNYMGKLGWNFEQAYVVTNNNQNVYHWLLSKEIGENGNIKEGFKTKEDFKK